MFKIGAAIWSPTDEQARKIHKKVVESGPEFLGVLCEEEGCETPLLIYRGRLIRGFCPSCNLFFLVEGWDEQRKEILRRDWLKLARAFFRVKNAPKIRTVLIRRPTARISQALTIGVQTFSKFWLANKGHTLGSTGKIRCPEHLSEIFRDGQKEVGVPDEKVFRSMKCPTCATYQNTKNAPSGRSTCVDCGCTFWFDRSGTYLDQHAKRDVRCAHCNRGTTIPNRFGEYDCIHCSSRFKFTREGATKVVRIKKLLCPTCEGKITPSSPIGEEKISCPHCKANLLFDDFRYELVASKKQVTCLYCGMANTFPDKKNHVQSCKMCSEKIYVVEGETRTGEGLLKEDGWKMCRHCSRYTNGPFNHTEPSTCRWCGEKNRLSTNNALYKWDPLRAKKRHFTCPGCKTWVLLSHSDFEDHAARCPTCGVPVRIGEDNQIVLCYPKTGDPEEDEKVLTCSNCGATGPDPPPTRNMRYLPDKQFMCSNCDARMKMTKKGLVAIALPKEENPDVKINYTGATRTTHKEAKTMAEKTLVKKTADKVLKHGVKGVKLSVATNVARVVDAKVMQYMEEHVPSVLKDTETGKALRLFLIPLILSTLAESPYGDVIPSKDKVVAVCGLAMEGSAKEAVDALSTSFLPMLKDIAAMDVPELTAKTVVAKPTK